jgi:DNA modification methylase
MRQPYFQDGAVTIYHGDCREILPLLEPVDLVLTDPPYGIEYVSGHYKYGNPFSPIVGDDKFPTDVAMELIALARAGAIIFGTEVALAPLQPDSWLVWAKNNWTAGDLEHTYARQHEVAGFWAGSTHHFANGRPRTIIDCPRVPPTSLMHPTEKPVALLKQLILHHTCQTILDPFMGSGTTLRAAKELGRTAIGIEVEERYCEIAAQRMAQGILNL